LVIRLLASLRVWLITAALLLGYVVRASAPPC
jgi:hypothetical protein